MKKNKEIKIGILTVLTIIILYWGINFLKGTNIFEKKQIYYAIYDKVNGLVNSNAVTVNGYKIGIVEDIRFLPDDVNGKLIVKLCIDDKSIKIPSNSIAKIQNDLLGTASVVIIMGNSKEKAVSGDTLKSETAATLQQEVSLQILPVKAKAENLMLSFDSVLAVVQSIFNEETRQNISKTFESIKIAVNNIEHASFNIDTLLSTEGDRLTVIFSNIESISRNIKNNNEKIANIIKNSSSLSDTLAKSELNKTINNTNQALAKIDNILQKIKEGQGSLGLLINNDSLYYKLESASNNLDLLIKDLKENPERYVKISVFGRKSKDKNNK